MAQTFRIVLISEKSGKTYSVKVHPGILIAALFFTIMLIGAVVFSGAGFLMMFQKHKALKASHEDLQRIVQRLRTEHHVSEPLASGTSAGQESVSQQRDIRSGDPQEISARQKSAGNAESVEVAGLEVHRGMAQRELRMSFSLINRVGRKRVSGYVCVVAQNTTVTPARRALWPEGELVGDMPKDYKKGIPFSIVHRKQVSGCITLPEDASEYNKLAVIVYDHSGNIITTQEYGLDLSSLTEKKS